jgi:stage V sporulation protein B
MDNGALVIAAIIYSGLMCLLNHRSLQKHLPVRLNIRHALYLPVLSSTVMAAAALGVYELISRLLSLFLGREYLVNLIALMPAIFAAIWVYALLLIRLGGIGENDIRRLPKGRLMVGFLKKIRIL